MIKIQLNADTFIFYNENGDELWIKQYQNTDMYGSRELVSITIRTEELNKLKKELPRLIPFRQILNYIDEWLTIDDEENRNNLNWDTWYNTFHSDLSFEEEGELK